MAIIDGQGATFTFNGDLVGGITRFITVDGMTPVVPHFPLGAKEKIYLPGVADFGMITLMLMRDFSDVGQIALENARAISLKSVGILRFSNGVGLQFPCFVVKLPIVGDDNGLGTADAVIKIAGKTTAA